MRRPAAVALASLLLAGCGGAAPPVPDGYVAYRVQGVSLRHPPGWTAERAAPQRDRPGTTVVLRPAGSNPDAPGPVATLTIEAAQRGVEEEVRSARAAIGGRARDLRVDVPGAKDAGGVRGKVSDGTVAFVAAARGDELIRLLARAPAGARGVDVAAIAGSLRLR